MAHETSKGKLKDTKKTSCFENAIPKNSTEERYSVLLIPQQTEDDYRDMVLSASEQEIQTSSVIYSSPWI